MVFCFECNSIEDHKINEIVNTLFLAGDKYMPKMHLKQLGFTDSACEKFTKNKERIQKLKELRDSRDICRIELDKGCFQLNIPY